MEANKQENAEEDLSMEDILQSIRRIIADDDAEGGAKPEASPEANLDDENPVAVSDILELTDMIEEDGSITNVKEEPAVDVLDNIDAALTPSVEPKPEVPVAEPKPEVPAVEPPAEPKPEAPVAEPAPQAPAEETKPAEKPPAPVAKSEPKKESGDSLDALLSKAAEEAAVSSLFKLKSSDEKPDIQSPPFRSGTTVEDMVEDLLRPMMKSWLDENLPTIVERVVEQEIMRLTRRQ